jgi:adenosylcobinamide-GDP ribazoletransferase
MRSLLVALSFLTVLPSGSRTEPPPAVFPRAIGFFPLVGAAIGLIVAGFDFGARMVLSAPVVGALDLALLAVLSGGLHLDGLADAADGLLPPVMSVEERLGVMRSGTVGAFGVVAIALALLAEFAALATLDPAVRALALVVAVTLSRWSMALALWTWPYARPTGVGRAVKNGLGAGDAAFATASALAIALLALGGAATGPVLASLLVTGVIGALALRRVAGVTGDICGAIGELSFAASLAALSGARA